MAAALRRDHIVVVTDSPRADNRIDKTAGLSSTLDDSFPGEAANPRSRPATANEVARAPTEKTDFDLTAPRQMRT
jgi:hypothetical protein